MSRLGWGLLGHGRGCFVLRARISVGVSIGLGRLGLALRLDGLGVVLIFWLRLATPAVLGERAADELFGGDFELNALGRELGVNLGESSLVCLHPLGVGDRRKVTILDVLLAIVQSSELDFLGLAVFVGGARLAVESFLLYFAAAGCV